MDVPFACELEVATVAAEEAEEADEAEDMEEEELLRCKLLRGMNMRLISSGFMAPAFPPPPLTLHAGRLCCVKVGGLATAVMEKRKTRVWLKMNKGAAKSDARWQTCRGS
jgi:hypothetical protein